MAEEGSTTFARLLADLIRQDVIKRDDSVLVQFAGRFDEDVCAAVGLVNCHFANIAPGSTSTGSTTAKRFDAHRMPHEDHSFDHVIAHAGLHHCSRPHEALHEMYRLARKSVFFVENQDSMAVRLLARIGLVATFENAAVVGAGYQSGGVDGMPVPNYVHRWTRREFRKTILSFDPAHEVPVVIKTEWNLRVNRVAKLQQRLHLGSGQSATLSMTAVQALLNKVLFRQGNIFAALVRKDLAELRPWMASPTLMRQGEGSGLAATNRGPG